ncbi:putative transcriptional regulator, LysR family protein [Arenicella chitinivorans]|uniref:Transcriptional regulator, LysR family protein n=1 Tax=Arenicella chitinivorans TaxID=1329800 RepID=A0A918RRI5_9GAMM|nr:LysR substrate-binding domain-containing protein [Arenicella chitinivorans]GHA06518.1 putative transcriptional regulator, LysR family protein [Arenicella chitinivorans]
MILDLEISHLKTLDALYRFDTVSAAAESLAISQQAVSLLLKRIQQILDDRLFVASGQGVVPTSYAKHIEPYVQQVLAAMHNIPLPTAFSPISVNQVLSIAATDCTQHTVVSSLITQVAELAPKVRVVVSSIESAELTRKMHQCVTLVRPLHRASPVSLQEITKYPFVVTSPSVGSFKGAADDWFDRVGFPHQVQVSSPCFQATQRTVQQTRLVALLPTRLPLIDGLSVVPLAVSPPGFAVSVVYHPSTKGDPFLAWVLSQIREKSNA